MILEEKHCRNWDGLHLSMPSRLGLADHNPLHTFKFARYLFVRKCLSWRGVVVPLMVRAVYHSLPLDKYQSF